MSLRVKTLLLVGSTLALILVILQVVLERIVEKGFDRAEADIARGFGQLEREEALRNAARAQDALRADLAHLAIKAADWAQWDDTWRYVVARDRAYERSNLVPATLRALRIEALAILDDRGKTVSAIAYDFGQDATASVPEGLIKLVRRHPAVAAGLGETDSVTGIVSLPTGIFLVAARPIVRSDGTGPVRGTILFARLLDGPQLHAIAATTHLDIGLERPPAGAQATPEPAPTDERAVDVSARPLSEEIYEGRILLRDLAGSPVSTLRVRTPRGIHRQAEATLEAIRARRAVTSGSVFGSVAATGALFAALLVAIMEGAILTRLSRLARSSADIGRTGDFTARVPPEGGDEIGALSVSVNAMLERLAAANARVAERDAAQRVVLDAVPAGLLMIDVHDIVAPVYSRAAEAMLGEPPAGREICGLLGLSQTQASFLREFLRLLRDRQLPGPEAAALNPVDEIRRLREGRERCLRLRFLSVDPEASDARILVVLEDVTVTRSLAAEVAASRQEKLEIMAIAENPDGFREFLLEIDRLLADARQRLLRALEKGRFDPLEGLRGLRERIEWIGGQARAFCDEQVIAAGARLSRPLEGAARHSIPRAGLADEIRAALAELARAHARAVELGKPLLLGAEADGKAPCPAEACTADIDRRMSVASDTASRPPPRDSRTEELHGRPHPIPVRRALANAVSTAAELAHRAGRCTSFRFEGSRVLIYPALARALEPSVLRLLRNAFLQGIESPEERLLAGKPEQGEVALSIWKGDHGLALTVSDDGRGIDPEVIRTQAVGTGMLTPAQAAHLSREECFALLFRRDFPGSGEDRPGTDPNGIAAVAGDIRRIGGDVAIDSAPGHGTRVTMWIPVVGGSRSGFPTAAEQGGRRPPFPGTGEEQDDLVPAGEF